MNKTFVFDVVDGLPIIKEGKEIFDLFHQRLVERNCVHLIPEGKKVVGNVTMLENKKDFVINCFGECVYPHDGNDFIVELSVLTSSDLFREYWSHSTFEFKRGRMIYYKKVEY